MSRSHGPLHAPTGSADPGLAKPIMAMIMVFVIGLACVGLILMVGHPIQATPDDELTQAPAPTDVVPPVANNELQMIPATKPVPPAQPYVSSSGTSPLPGFGESETSLIPPSRLIDEQVYDAPPPPDGPVPWDQAYKYLGQVITVEGKIVDTHNTGDICFLNFDTDWQDKFYVAMFREAFELLPDPPQDHYLNKTLLVTGKVTLHRDRPQIEVHDVNQIEVVE